MSCEVSGWPLNKAVASPQQAALALVQDQAHPVPHRGGLLMIAITPAIPRPLPSLTLGSLYTLSSPTLVCASLVSLVSLPYFLFPLLAVALVDAIVGGFSRRCWRRRRCDVQVRDVALDHVAQPQPSVHLGDRAGECDVAAVHVGQGLQDLPLGAHLQQTAAAHRCRGPTHNSSSTPMQGPTHSSSGNAA